MSLMDVIDGFRGKKPPSSAESNPAVPSGATPGSDGKTVAAIPQTAVGEANPLENYKDLWIVDTTKPAPTQPTMVPNLTIDPAKIMEASRQMDFTKGMDPTVLDKATKGDAESLLSLINSAAQNAYAQGAAASANIVRTAFTLQDKTFNDTVMPAILRKNEVSRAIAEHPLSANPAAAPLLGLLEQQFATKFPTASPSEIKKHAETYLGGLAEELVRSQGGSITKKEQLSNEQNAIISRGGDNTDWEKFFGESSTTAAA